MTVLDLQPNSAPGPGEPARQRSIQPRKTRAFLFTVSGIVMMVITPIIGFGLAVVNPVLGILFSVPCATFAAWLIRKGKRYKALGADDVLAHDARPPVLYLRSFRADEKTGEAVGQALSIQGFDLTVPTTEEEQVAKLVGRIGPLVAIGRPSESIPMLGAARMYLADDQWQARVLDMMHKSSIVLMRAGKTEGFWWEVEQAVRHVRPERLIWLVPFSKDNYTAFAERANSLLPKPIPTDAGTMTYTVGSIKGWIWFESDWTPHLEKPRLADTTNRSAPVGALLHRALAPVFYRIGEVNASLRCSGLPRLAAFLVDFVVLSLVASVVFLISANPYAILGMIAALYVLYFLVLDLPACGGTVGKRLAKVKIVNSQGEALTPSHAVLRGFAKGLSILLLPLTFLYGIIAFSWSIRRRMPHDLITNTFVVDHMPT